MGLLPRKSNAISGMNKALLSLALMFFGSTTESCVAWLNSWNKSLTYQSEMTPDKALQKQSQEP